MMVAPTTYKHTTLRSEEFTCPSCVKKIETKLENLAGVESAKVGYSTGRILIVHDPEQVSAQDLVHAVAEVGYTARPSAI